MSHVTEEPQHTGEDFPPTPDQQPAASPAVAVGTHFIEQLYLYAFAPQFEVRQYIRTQAIQEEVDRLPDLIAAWQAVQPAVQALQNAEPTVPDTVQVTDVPAEHVARVDEITADPLFQNTFATYAISIQVVELDKLIAAQRAVNLSYVQKLASQLQDDLSSPRLLEFCLSPRQTTEPIQPLELIPNVHAFTSPNSDLRFLGAYQKDVSAEDLKYAIGGGLPAAAVIAFVGYGASSINAFQVGGRVFLNNGFHRIYALRTLGVARAPIVVQHVKNVQLEFPAAIAGMPREYLLATPRPALIRDFSQAEFTTKLKIKDRMKMVLINVAQPGQQDVPA